MESVIWAFKQLHDKGLAYEGYRVLPYCWHDQTPLSNHELRMDDDVYKMRQDQTVTVTFPLVGEAAEALGLAGVRALAWTTTPWTLPTNLALAVGPAHRVRRGAERAARARPMAAAERRRELPARHGHDRRPRQGPRLRRPPPTRCRQSPRRSSAAELDGVRYQPLWDYYADTDIWGTENAWQILLAEYVETGEGTGIVHQAPAYGEDDQIACAAAGIPVVLSVDDGRTLPADHRAASPACRCSTRTSRSPSNCGPRAGCSRSPATSTAIRTAGAAATR